MEQRISWDEYFSNIARDVSLRSVCSRRKIGAVIVSPDNHIISTGYNGPHVGAPNCPTCVKDKEGLSSGTGHDICTAIHAEINALIQGGKQNKSSTLYLNATPCNICARVIINAGISTFVSCGDYTDKGGLKILEDAGIKIVKLVIPKTKTDIQQSHKTKELYKHVESKQERIQKLKRKYGNRKRKHDYDYLLTVLSKKQVWTAKEICKEFNCTKSSTVWKIIRRLMTENGIDFKRKYKGGSIRTTDSQIISAIKKVKEREKYIWYKAVIKELGVYYSPLIKDRIKEQVNILGEQLVDGRQAVHFLKRSKRLAKIRDKNNITIRPYPVTRNYFKNRNEGIYSILGVMEDGKWYCYSDLKRLLKEKMNIIPNRLPSFISSNMEYKHLVKSKINGVVHYRKNSCKNIKILPFSDKTAYVVSVKNFDYANNPEGRYYFLVYFNLLKPQTIDVRLLKRVLEYFKEYKKYVFWNIDSQEVIVTDEGRNWYKVNIDIASKFYPKISPR